MTRQQRSQQWSWMWVLCLGFLGVTLAGCDSSSSTSENSQSTTIRVIFPQEARLWDQDLPDATAASPNRLPARVMRQAGNLVRFLEVSEAQAQAFPSSIAALILHVTDTSGTPFPDLENVNIPLSTGRVTVPVPLGPDRVFIVDAFPACAGSVRLARNFTGQRQADVGGGGTTVTVVMKATDEVVAASPGDQSRNEGQAVSIAIGAGNSHCTPLTFSAIGTLPPGLSLNPSTGVITGTPAPGAAGTYTVTITASDGTHSTTTTFILTVVNRCEGVVCNQHVCATGTCDQPTGQCVYTPVAGAVCRASAGECDVAEVCDGSSLDCPANAFQPVTTVCRASAGVCDAAETCTGTSAACPVDAFQSATTVCRTAAGVCDVAETCTGSSATCLADAKRPDTFVCRASAGVCDVAETCTGTSNACPANAFQPATTVCRPTVDASCDPVEQCTGTGPACPADVNNCSELLGTNDDARLPKGSCQPSGSLAVLVTGTTVVAYVPKGNWSSAATDVAVVNVEGNSIIPTLIPTPNAVNSCASNPLTGQTVCTANNTDVYVISSTTLNATLTSGGSESDRIFFSGGSCTNCGVAMDAANNKAVITLSLSGVGGYQYLNLDTFEFEPAFKSQSGQISENILLDPIRNLILSPNEDGNFEIVDVATTTHPAFYGNVDRAVHFDSASEDCSTGIVLASVEFDQPSSVYIADFAQATFTPGTPGTWSAVSQVQPLSESFLSRGASGIAVAQGTSKGILTGETEGATPDSGTITAIALPTAAPDRDSTAPPFIEDWVTCRIPGFATGPDPRTVTAYQSPNGGDAIALLANDGATMLAVINLTKMLDRIIVPRTPGGHACISGTLPAPPCVAGILPAGVMCFIDLTALQTSQ